MRALEGALLSEFQIYSRLRKRCLFPICYCLVSKISSINTPPTKHPFLCTLASSNGVEIWARVHRRIPLGPPPLCRTPGLGPTVVSAHPTAPSLYMGNSRLNSGFKPCERGVLIHLWQDIYVNYVSFTHWQAPQESQSSPTWFQ